ncbi:hypothetical protein Tco_1348357 [Tanacetum coccineum]
MGSFVINLNVNIVIWNYHGMQFYLIMNLYVPFGILFDHKRYYKDGVYTRMLRRPRYEGLQYSDADIVDFEARLARIYRREVHMVQVFDFGGLPELMVERLSARMLMEHMDAQGVSLFTSRAWRRLFDIRGLLVHELILEFFSTFMFGEAILYLDTLGVLQFQLGRARRHLSWRQFIVALGLHMREEMESPSFARYWVESARQIPDKGDLRDYWIGISSARDLLGTTLYCTTIRDPILRLCHRLIACSITGRIQAPEKVAVTDLFYLRGMDVGSVNIPYLLDRYLRLFAVGRKRGAHISGGQFNYIEIDDTWDWVAIEPERQPDAAAGAPRVAQNAPTIDEGVQAVPTPVHAPRPLPLVATRTMPHRMVRLEEDVHGICEALAEQHKVISAMARDFSRFTVWAASGIAQILDSAQVSFTPYFETRTPY